MALALMHECRRRNVDCIVAPYEADAQLAYLNLKNIAQIVITEDSDLVLFGCTKVCRQTSHIHLINSLLANSVFNHAGNYT
jgi:exonuclease-1